MQPVRVQSLMLTLTPAPTLQQWKKYRKNSLIALHRLLGYFPPPSLPEITWLETFDHFGLPAQKFQFDNQDPICGPGSTVAGYFIKPPNAAKPVPGLLFCHWHGGQYDLGKNQLLQTSSTGLTYAQELVSKGYAALCIDCPGFGERAGTGPNGTTERGQAEEQAWFKLHLWHGRTLWGAMLRDQYLALQILRSLPEINPNRIGVLGISLGCSLATWMMALHTEIRVCVGVACTTRYQELIEDHGLNRHSIYYYVPGILQHFDMEVLHALCAPRALLCLNGAEDKLAPPKGVRRIEEDTASIYSAYNAHNAFKSIVYPGVGHAWTPEMWHETHAWLNQWLNV